MSTKRINKRIINSINEHNEGDANIVKFLQELILEESEHSGNWWYKELYKNKIDDYLKILEGNKKT